MFVLYLQVKGERRKGKWMYILTVSISEFTVVPTEPIDPDTLAGERQRLGRYSRYAEASTVT